MPRQPKRKNSQRTQRTRARRSRTKPTVAVIGYRSQGRAIALNLFDSGFPVVVGLRTRSKSRRIAGREGIREITTVAKAAEA
ncbi:hypothetical protein GF377_05895, partial [candidate division GN15 bacterium]|nr:hypothetical protein [candidate division GN15 bacterium]